MSSTAHSTSPPVPQDQLRSIVELAGRAPSVHNTQPWRWRGYGATLELHADRTRQLTHSDPDGRNLVISCGTALHHAEVAADAFGWATTTSILPDRARPDLLARLDLTPAKPTPNANAQLDALRHRCTDRRRFTSWPVPDARLTHLAATANLWGGHAIALIDATERFRAERLIHLAADLQRGDAPVRHEQESWVDHDRVDGVPSAVLPAPIEVPVRRPSRFSVGMLDDSNGEEVEGSDGLLVLVSGEDDVRSWLSTGRSLSALWLAATQDGLSIVPLSQVVEVPETRDAFRLQVCAGLAQPQLVVRVGWQSISRSQLVPTPRPPVEDILELG